MTGRLLESGFRSAIETGLSFRALESYAEVIPTVPPTIEGSSVTQGAGTGDRTVTPHTGVLAGDLLVLVNAYISTADIPAPAGWTTLKARTALGTLASSCFARIRQPGDTSYVLAVTSTTNSSHACLNIRGWSGNIADVIVGADGTRAASGGLYRTTAPSITTPVDNELVLCIATERTTATETGIAAADNGFGERLWLGHGAGGIESIWIGTKLIVAGPTGATSVDYVNAQAINGLAYHLAIRPA